MFQVSPCSTSWTSPRFCSQRQIQDQAQSPAGWATCVLTNWVVGPFSGLKKVTTAWLIVRHSASISSHGAGKQKALRHSYLDPEFGIQSPIIPESNPSFACFFLHAPGLSSVKVLPHRTAVTWHEITHVKSTLAITDACSTLPGARGCSRAFHLILIQSEKEGAFSLPHTLFTQLKAFYGP